MKYSRFEELPVWKDAIELAVRVYRFTTHDAFKGRYSLKDQLERAAVSISNNIAEGFERRHNAGSAHLPLYCAVQQGRPVRSYACVSDSLAFRISDLRSQISN